MAVVSVTLLGGSGAPPRSPLSYPPRVGDCVTIQERKSDCDGRHAWYRVRAGRPAAGRCPAGQRASENGKFCLEPLRPVEVDTDVDIPPLTTPDRQAAPRMPDSTRGAK